MPEIRIVGLNNFEDALVKEASESVGIIEEAEVAQNSDMRLEMTDSQMELFKALEDFYDSE